MNPVKRGICISQQQGTWIYAAHRRVGISENAVIKRLIEIGISTLNPLQDAQVRRILREPWEAVRKNPRLLRQMRKTEHSDLLAVTATRLTLEDKRVLRDLAKDNKTTMSALQRQAIERILTKEKSD